MKHLFQLAPNENQDLIKSILHGIWNVKLVRIYVRSINKVAAEQTAFLGLTLLSML